MTSTSHHLTPMVHQPSSPAKASPIGQAMLALAIGFALLVTLVALVPGAYSYVYDRRIYPGVAVGGVDLSGMTTPQAAALLGERLDYPTRGQIAFHRRPTQCL